MDFQKFLLLSVLRSTVASQALLVLFFLNASVPTLFARTEAILCIDENFRSVNALPYAQFAVGSNWEQCRLAGGWEPVKGSVIKIAAGRTNWLRLMLHNNDRFDRSLELFLHSITISEARIFVVENGRVDSAMRTGNLVPYHARATPRRDMSLPLTVKSGQKIEVYVSIFRRGLPDTVTFTLADVQYGDGTQWEHTLAMVVFGFCLLICLIALAFSTIFKDLEYRFYLGYVCFGSLYLLASNGYIAYFLPNAMWFLETAPVFFIALGITGFILFSRIVLNVGEANRIMNKILGFIPYVALLLISAGFAFSAGLISSGAYILTAKFAGMFCVITLTYIFQFSFKRVFGKRELVYWWFIAIFFNLFILILVALILETNWVFIDRKWVVLLRAIMVPLEIALSQMFLITRIDHRIKNQQKKELEAQRQSLNLTQQKEEQQRYYSNILHNVIKGKTSSAIIDIRNGNPVDEQLYELIGICEFGDTFLKIENEDAYTLLEELAFRSKRRLHSDVYERNFYSELDSSLKGVLLSQSQKYELIFFIYEAVYNTFKYSRYRNASLKVKNRIFHSQEHIVLEMADDGVGFQEKFGISDKLIKLDENSFTEFEKKYFSSNSHTGIRRLFDHAKYLKGRLIIESQKAEGVWIELTFPNPG